MFGFIIFCILCYLLYRFDKKYANYRIVKSIYNNNDVKYKLQRKLFKYFWFTRRILDNRYHAEQCYIDIIRELDDRRKKKVSNEVLTELQYYTNSLSPSSHTQQPSASLQRGGSQGHSGYIDEILVAGNCGTSGTAPNPNITTKREGIE